MARRSPTARLTDIVNAIAVIRRELDGVTLAAFEAETSKKWIVERGLEIISEASRHLSADVKARHQAIPWPKIAAIGNVLRHAYDRVAADVLWRTAQDDLPPLEKVCRQELLAGEAAGQAPGALIYHLCSQSEWTQSVTTGQHTAGGMPDGFIHFSTRAQVLESAARHFAGRTDLMLVAVDPDRLGAALKWEASRGGALFPHLYGPLDPAIVAWAVPLPVGPDGPRFPDPTPG